MGIKTIVKKLCENLYEEKEGRKKEILKEVEEEIKKEIKYEDKEKVLPGDIKVIERKIIKDPIHETIFNPYNNNLYYLTSKVVKEEIGGVLKKRIKEHMGSKKGWEDYYESSVSADISRVEDEIRCLALRYITNGRFPSYYTAVHVYNAYLGGRWCNGIREYKVKTAFDEVLNDKVRFSIWISFADNFKSAAKGERLFVFGKKNPAFKKALEKTAKKFETKYLSFKKLYNYMIVHPTQGLSYSWREIILDGHSISTGHLDLLGEIEKTKEVVLVGPADSNINNMNDKYRKREEFIRGEGLEPLAIATLMHYDIPLFTCPTNGVKIDILGDIKFRDAEMYVDIMGYTRDKYKILSKGPKVIFFYDPYKEQITKKE
jgi:hypothetical protein